MQAVRYLMSHSPQHYRDTAASLRRLAEALPKERLRNELLKLAQDYESLADSAERRNADMVADKPSSKSKMP